MNSHLLGTSTTNSMTIDVEKLGAPGTRGVLTVVPVYNGRESSDEEWVTDRSERTFVASVLLAKQVTPTVSINGSFSSTDGASYLRPPPDKTGLEVSTSLGNFVIDTNEIGELSMVTMSVTAIHFDQARDRFFAAILPLIDHLSYVANVPIMTGTSRIKDAKHEVQEIEFTSPFTYVQIADHESALDIELAPIFGLFREARNSGSPFYQVLCYYKIMEGIAELKGRLRKLGRKAGFSMNWPEDNVPHNSSLIPDFHAHVGKSIESFKNRVLTKTYRDAVAHFELKGGSALHVSAPEELSRFFNVAFACELCVKVMIENYKTIRRSFNDAMREKDGVTTTVATEPT